MTAAHQPESSLLIPNSFRLYHPDLVQFLKTLDLPKFRLSERKFSNLMPLLISDESPHAVMMWLLNGDNWEAAILDMFRAHALTQKHNDLAGTNVDRLGVLALFADFRQDRRTRKPIPETSNEMAIVKSQASFSKAIARLMKYVAGVDYLVTLDAHSSYAINQFLEEGIDVINLTAAFKLAEEIKKKELINKNLETIVCGLDMGNLALVKALSEYLDLPIAIIRKWREAIFGGTQSKTKHELVYGDVSGKRIILVDDMGSSGGTLAKTIELLLKNGAKEIIICVTHAVLSGNNYYETFQDILDHQEVKLVMTTNSIPLLRPTGEEKDKPYVIQKDNEKQIEELEIFDLSQFISWVLSTLLLNDDLESAREILLPHTLQLEDPYEIYEKITGQKIKKPKDKAVYRGGGHFDPLP